MLIVLVVSVIPMFIYLRSTRSGTDIASPTSISSVPSPWWRNPWRRPWGLWRW